MAGMLDRLKAGIVGRPRSRPQDADRGACAEALAADYLQRQGLRILARNVRYRGGELDLVCADGDTVVFVEVRLRSNARFGGAAASITPAKQARLIHAAQLWLAAAPAQLARAPCRFDAVLLDRLQPDAPEWLRGAFDAA